MSKISRVSFFIFVFFYNYLWLRIIVFDDFYNNLGTSGFIISLLLLFGVMVIFILIPKKVLNKNYSELINRSFIKWILLILSLLEIIFNICYISYFINEVFIVDSNIYILLIIISLVVIFISNLLPYEIIDLSTIFNIVGFLLIGISFIFKPKVDVEYLFMFENFKILKLIPYIFFIVFDNLKLLISKDKLNFKRRDYLLAIFLGLLLYVIEYGLLIMTVGDKALIDLSYVGFLELSFMPVTKYLGDFNFVYIYLLMVCGIFKNGFDLSQFKNMIGINKNIINTLLGLLIVGCALLSIYSIPVDTVLDKYVIMIMLLFGILLIWMIWKCYFVRKDKR